MTDRTMIALLQCQLQAAEERASVWERIANGERAEAERLREILEDMTGYPEPDGYRVGDGGTILPTSR